jgi:ABC-type Zn uptake system ZnuABC Zn-binding protein ZnuA
MWTAIALIVIASIIAGAVRQRDSKGSSAINAELQAMQEKLDHLDNDLRNRVETLERIVTDRAEDLKRQFDHLDKAS